MLMASKYFEIDPLTTQSLVNQAFFKDFSESDLIEEEMKVFETLEFEIQTPTIYDFAKYFIRLLKAKCTYYFSEIGIPLSEEAVDFFIEVNQLLMEMCKTSLIDVEFQAHKPSDLAAGHLTNALIFVTDLRKDSSSLRRFTKRFGSTIHKLWEDSMKILLSSNEIDIIVN